MVYGGNLLRDSVRHHSVDGILKKCPLWYARYRDEPIDIPVASLGRDLKRPQPDAFREPGVLMLIAMLTSAFTWAASQQPGIRKFGRYFASAATLDILRHARAP